MANLATISGNILGDSGIDSIDLIVGTGTVNYIPKFTAEGNIGNSLLVDNGSILSYNGNQVVTLNVGDSRYLMGTTNPGSVNNFTISIGNNGSYSYVQSHSSQPLELNPLGNTVRIAGNIVLHAGNYGSYALPLSGGTVNGNITANIYKVYSSGTYPSIDAVRGSYFGYSQSYPVIVIGTATVGGGAQTLAFNVDPIANPSGAFTGHGNEYMFRNVGSFITPNSANSAYNTLLSWDSSGNITSANSFRAPIFYDSDNTGYYADLASGTNIQYLNVNGTWGSSPFASGHAQLNITGTYPSITLRQTDVSQFYTLLHNADAFYIYTGRGATNGTDWNWGLKVMANQDGNYVQFRTSARAPIFYDSENTGYYLDPNSASVLLNLGVGGVYPDVRLSVSGDAHISQYLYMGGTAGSVGSWGTRMLSSGGNLTLNSVSFTFNNVGYGSDWSFTLSAGGHAVASGSMRAPIFYDSDDTGYYLDLNSASNAALRMRGGALFGPNPTWGAYLQVGGDGRAYSHASVVATSGNLHLDAANGYSTYINYYSGGTIYLGTSGTYTITGNGSYYNGTSAYSNNSGALNGWGYTSYAYRASGSGYYQIDTWIALNGNHGIFAPGATGFSSTPHFSPNTSSSYGAWVITGARNGWGGINLQDPSGYNHMYMHESGNGGLLSHDRWVWYYHRGNNSLGICGSTTSSSYALYVSGTIYATGDVIAYSDRRKKTNIINIDNALDRVSRMRGVFYDKIGEEDKGRQLGVIAQEVEEIIPEAVSYAADIDEYGVKYGNMVGLLLEAIKELKSEIEVLKKNN